MGDGRRQVIIVHHGHLGDAVVAGAAAARAQCGRRHAGGAGVAELEGGGAAAAGGHVQPSLPLPLHSSTPASKNKRAFFGMLLLLCGASHNMVFIWHYTGRG